MFDGLYGSAKLDRIDAAELAVVAFFRASRTCVIWDRRGSCSRRDVSIWSMEASGGLASQVATTIIIASTVAPNKA